MHEPLVTEFATTDPEQACALIAEAYRDNRLRVRGTVENYRFEHNRCDLGDVHFDFLHNTLTTEVVVEPLGRVVLLRVLDGELEIDDGVSDRRFGAGDVFVGPHPGHDYRTGMHCARLQVIGIDLSLFTGIDPAQDGRSIERLCYEPVRMEKAQRWRRTVEYMTGLLSEPGVENGPLVLGAAGRLMAAMALDTFTTGTGDDRIGDRRDAVPATVRRGIAFLEANPDLDLGVADIAHACRVSVRALQLAFRRYLDTTPMAYLRNVRLHQARTELRDADPGGDTTVTGVAAKWGFLDGSRFSAQYRAAFGESPSETLRKR
ncbi:AraC family transcriptional regulator [Amycolatopsis sp. WAC 01375]|uniref:helix-turn-helix transcriptional regulator n=1 Tax=unclassified Amycolatopsis TaxID=2618356 RepID=UPI000F78E133|nr:MULTISPECIES: helix-turn-helix transcriptional regulator [unclassified Amycolatopsis]RSM75577.1 AraC family transcriptional regulator [Amycolatopsis sp. WAC 01375]RSN26044.1 AraC family transcriptional regulator [Amycolatopsis sp. WAC 01416]